MEEFDCLPRVESGFFECRERLKEELLADFNPPLTELLEAPGVKPAPFIFDRRDEPDWTFLNFHLTPNSPFTRGTFES